MSVHQVRCPACGGPSPFTPTNAWRPFCSERCRLEDLAAWAEDRYRVAAAPSEDDLQGEPAPSDGGPRG